MLKINDFRCESLAKGCVTDEKKPVFSFAAESDRHGVTIQNAVLTVNGETIDAIGQIAVPYSGKALEPYTVYEASLSVTDSHGETAAAALSFETGKMEEPWTAEWISDSAYLFTEKKVSPVPMVFRRSFRPSKPVASARIYATALGIYELTLNGEKVGDRFFAPGFTSYPSNLQYQTYDITGLLSDNNELIFTVAGGWAVGSFVFTRVNRYAADRQALLCEVRLTYTDGTVEVIGTGTDWQVSEDGPVRMADLYDGETYDATVDPNAVSWRSAAKETLRVHPKIFAETGAPVRAHERFRPVSCKRVGSELIYDFGQNMAGVVSMKLNGRAGQTVTVRHAEILNPDGTLNTTFLRTAKATATYTCTDGEQTYMPRLTYMGFRYAAVEGIEPENIEIEAVALYSDLDEIGTFSCSNEMINQLQSNIVWGAKSNLVDIPTDCPQRDERMGWTGDIAVFGPTACFNFDMRRFLDKWLRDVRAEQRKGGGLPNTVPVNGYGFPATMPEMAIDWWGDASVLVPWALYRATGDRSVLEENYPMMKKYVKACRFWANLLGFGKHRYIWHTPAVFHFGDWVAPDAPKMSEWQKRSKWTATASLKNTSATAALVAEILGKADEAEEYRMLAARVSDAYETLLTDGNGKLNEEFQTAYVLPLYFDMFREENVQKAADNLAGLVKKNGYRIGTGFPGTPYILFALADHGHAEDAYRMLLNTDCPSWLFEVRQGATTIWERWDGLDENGVCPIGDDGTDIMISYNHYASGAVGDFLYRRVAGLEPVEPGYRCFRICPLLGGDLLNASASVRTPYGLASSSWKIENGEFVLTAIVPVGTSCEIVLPDGSTNTIGSGTYTFRTKLS